MESINEGQVGDHYDMDVSGISDVPQSFYPFNTNNAATTTAGPGYNDPTNASLIPTSGVDFDFFPNETFTNDQNNSTTIDGQQITSNAPDPSFLYSAADAVGTSYETIGLGLGSYYPHRPPLPSQYAHQVFSNPDSWAPSTIPNNGSINAYQWMRELSQWYYLPAPDQGSDNASFTMPASAPQNQEQQPVPTSATPHNSSFSTTPQHTSVRQPSNTSSTLPTSTPQAQEQTVPATTPPHTSSLSNTPQHISSQWAPKLRNLAPAAPPAAGPSHQHIAPLASASPPSDATTLTVSKTYRKRKNEDESDERRKRPREFRACVRCRMYHLSCDELEPCEQCQIAAQKAIFFQPCQRPDLADIIVFRTGNARAGQENPQLPKLTWTSEDPKSRLLRLVYPFKNKLPEHVLPVLELSIRRFKPSERDFLDDSYSDADGNLHSIRHPAFASNNKQQMSSRFKDFIEKCQPYLEEEMAGVLSQDHLIMFHTLREARRVTAAEATRQHSTSVRLAGSIIAQTELKANTGHQHGFVSIAMRLLTFVYFSGPALLVADSSVIPLPEKDGEECDPSVFAEGVPAPSVLDFQLDIMSIQHMTELLHLLQRQMKKRYFCKANKAHWYEVYLATFLLLASLERVHQHQLNYIRECKAMDKVFTTRVDFVYRSLIDKWEHSAKNLIYHFRALLRGQLPFGDLPAKDLRSLDGTSRAYLTTIKELVREKNVELNLARESAKNDRYDRPMYWLSQLFLEEEN